jgi:hypothetical protein
VLLIGACVPISNAIVGFKQPKSLNEKEILKLANQFKIQEFPVFELDTSYSNFIKSKIKGLRERHVLVQPILILFFIQDTIVSINNNCFFPGLPNINWNEFGTFNSFPPKSGYNSNELKNIQIKDIKRFFHPLNSKAIQVNNESFNKILLVNYNRTYKRQCKNLTKLLLNKYKNDSQTIFFINNDDYLTKYLNQQSDDKSCEP